MSFLKKIFGKNKGIEDILIKHERAQDFYDAHFECYTKMLEYIISKESELLQKDEPIKMIVKIGSLMQSKIEKANDINEIFSKKDNFSNELAIKIIKQVLFDIYDKGYVNHYIKFIAMDILETSYKKSYNKGEDMIHFNFKNIAEDIIISIFSNYELILKLANKSYKLYHSAISNASKNKINIENIEFNDSLESMVAGIISFIKNKTNISREEMQEFTIKGMDQLITNLGVDKINSGTDGITSGIEHFLFLLMAKLGFSGGLNQIPSFNIIALAQTRREMNNEDYLPTTEINLTRGEKFLCDKEAIYRKLRNSREWTGTYYGLTSSIKIAKGLRFRMGHIVMPKQRVEKLEDIDIGTLYLTNKRVLFKGKKKTFSIDMNKLLSVELSEYGLLLFKNGNENPYILCLNDEDYYVIGEVISDILNK